MWCKVQVKTRTLKLNSPAYQLPKIFGKGGIGPNDLIEQGSCKKVPIDPAMAPTVLSLLLIIY